MSYEQLLNVCFIIRLATVTKEPICPQEMSIHYKFKSAIAYDTITFDGPYISVTELKKNIFEQKKLGKATDFDLQITNAQTGEGTARSYIL